MMRVLGIRSFRIWGAIRHAFELEIEYGRPNATRFEKLNSELCAKKVRAILLKIIPAECQVCTNRSRRPKSLRL